MQTTEHYDRVKAMMELIPGQETPDEITIPDAETRILRTKLILEEALETFAAMGVRVFIPTTPEAIADEVIELNTNTEIYFAPTDKVDLLEVADGLGDISVVVTGSMIAFGIPDKPLLEEIDRSNMSKFEDGYLREDGKWCKGPNWTPPNIAKAIGL